MLSIEGCGTGAGFLHHNPEPEIAHFRSWLKLASWKTGRAGYSRAWALASRNCKWVTTTAASISPE
ncbi:hypothetical protein ACN28S_21605 [Cystobacter fuscus]